MAFGYISARRIALNDNHNPCFDFLFCELRVSDPKEMIRQLFSSALIVSFFMTAGCVSKSDTKTAKMKVLGCYSDFSYFVSEEKISADQIYFESNLKNMILRRLKMTESARKENDLNPSLSIISVLSTNPIFQYNVRPEKFRITSISKTADSVIVDAKMQWDPHTKDKAGILSDMSTKIVLNSDYKISNIYFSWIEGKKITVSLTDFLKRDIEILSGQ